MCRRPTVTEIIFLGVARLLPASRLRRSADVEEVRVQDVTQLNVAPNRLHSTVVRSRFQVGLQLETTTHWRHSAPGLWSCATAKVAPLRADKISAGCLPAKHALRLHPHRYRSSCFARKSSTVHVTNVCCSKFLV